MVNNNLAEELLKSHLLIGRTMVQLNNIEMVINSYIAEYYTRCPNADYKNSYAAFIYDVLDDKYISINSKIDVLFKIFKRIDASKVNKGDREIFNKWLKIRNTFAHGKMSDKDIFYRGEFQSIKRLADESMGYQIKINLVLFDTFSELMGKYFNVLPIRDDQK